MSQDLKDILVASCYVHAASAHSSSSNSTFQSQIQTLHSLCARRRQVLTVSANGVIQPHAFQSHGAGVNGAGAARGGPGGRPMRQAITAHFDPQTNVIDVHVSRLRAKIDRDFDAPLLHTVRGAGYMIRDGSR